MEGGPGLFPQAKVVVDPFHLIADANQRLDEARRLEGEVRGRKVDRLLERYPNLKPFYWGKEKLRELYRQENRAAAGWTWWSST